MLSCSSSVQVIQKNQNLTTKTDDPPSPAILAIYLDQAQDLPVGFPSSEAPPSMRFMHVLFVV